MDVGPRGAPVKGVFVGAVDGEGLPCKAILFRTRRAWGRGSLEEDFQSTVSKQEGREEEKGKWVTIRRSNTM